MWVSRTRAGIRATSDEVSRGNSIVSDNAALFAASRPLERLTALADPHVTVLQSASGYAPSSHTKQGAVHQRKHEIQADGAIE